MPWEYKSGKGIWQQYINTETGEKSLNEITPKVVKVYCKEHYFVQPTPSSREVVCRDCGIGSKYVPGLHVLIDGKLTNIILA